MRKVCCHALPINKSYFANIFYILLSVTQILRGVVAAPQAIIAPRQGKWWNEATHEWVYTDLSKVQVPANDDDLLQTLKDELDADGKATGSTTGAVKDTFYYDALEVSVTMQTF